jgi:hypothetical protein
MKPLIRFFRLSPRSMPETHGNDNDTARKRRVAEIRRLLAEIAVESPHCRPCPDQDERGRYALRAGMPRAAEAGLRSGA